MSADFLVEDLRALARVPSAVPLGARTLMPPDDPILTSYVRDHLQPRFAEMVSRLDGATLRTVPTNQLVVQLEGRTPGPTLLLMAYTPSQHHNQMDDPWSGDLRVPAAGGEAAIFGQGVTQNKAHQAVLLDLLRGLGHGGGLAAGTLYLGINNEGRSSHACSDAILDALPTPPDLVVELFCTDFDVTVGNRGRVDIHIELHGHSTHSSTPPPDGRVLDAAADVLLALRETDRKVRVASHPELGNEQVLPYLVSYEPLAPHTLPNRARITVDRRLLPGTTPAAATALLTDDLLARLGPTPGGCQLSVREGVAMLPYLLPAGEQGVLEPLDAAIRARRGHVEHTIYGGTFDAGGPAARGLPTVMFGVPDEGELLGDDFVRLSALRDEAAIVRDAVVRFSSHAGRRSP